jgi:hypothetical protein
MNDPEGSHKEVIMAYLDVSPMIVALRTQASDFELSRGCLRHVPSRHNFKFDKRGNVTVGARCNCSSLSVDPEQSLELWTEFQVWREVYWRPALINREFASQFRAPNVFQRAFRRLLLAWRRATRWQFDERASASPTLEHFDEPGSGDLAVAREGTIASAATEHLASRYSS